MKKSRGVSLAEYGLIAGLVAMLSVPALFKLGHELSNAFASILPASGTSASASGAGPVAGMPATKPSSPASSPASHPTSSMADVPSLLSIPDLTRSVQTAGVNGTTTVLADSLVAISNQLLKEGSIDPDTYNAIVALANQGHTLAQIEASIEVAAKAAGNGGGSAFGRTKAELNGKTYSGPELVAMLNSTGPDIKVFRALQNQVLNDASITDPAVKSILSQLSNNILNIADASATSGDWINHDGGGINSYDSFTDDLPEMIADYARKTKGNSNGICSTQQNTAACTR